jgi:hypothetical protein
MDDLFGDFIGLVCMAAVPGYAVLQWRLATAMRGRLRIAALAPLVVMVPLLGYTLLAFAAGSNLWPLLLILVAPVAFLYLCGVWAVKAARAKG